LWGNVTWRANNLAMQKAALAYPNGHYLDYAAYVESAHVPYSDDGAHPTPEGMTMRARWLASQLK
jgi:lysophospholipase L1-like esterase